MNLALLLKNKHTSGAAVVALLASGFAHLGPLWFPHLTDQFRGTADWIKDAAIIYGLASSPDASQAATKDDVAQTKQELNTAFITKTSVQNNAVNPTQPK